MCSKDKGEVEIKWEPSDVNRITNEIKDLEARIDAIEDDNDDGKYDKDLEKLENELDGLYSNLNSD